MRPAACRVSVPCSSARLTRRLRSHSWAAVLCLAFVGSVDATAQVTRNTREVGYIALPSGSSAKGLWSYETGGKFYCLQTRGTQGLAILDMTDPTNPTLVQNVAGTYRKVQVYQNFAYVTNDSGPTRIIDLTVPESATVVGTLSTGGHTLRVDETMGRLYLNRSSSGMNIYDLTADPTSPQLLGVWPSYVHDCRPVGNIVYTNGFQTNPTRILDVSHTGFPAQIGTLPAGNHSSAYYVAPSGLPVLLTCDEAAGGHVQFFDVSDPSQPVQIASYQTDVQASVHNVEVRGVYAYVAYYQDQLRVLDISDPSNPVEAGVWDNNPTNTGGTFSDAWEAIPHHDAVYMNQMYDTSAGNQGTFAIDFFPGFGDGSPGTGGVVPEIWWSHGPASPGNDRFALRLTNALPNSQAFLIAGLSNSFWGALPLPLPLGALGAANASLYVRPDLLLGTSIDAEGNGRLELPVAVDAPFGSIYVQWLVKDPGAPNSGGWAVTGAGTIVIY